MPAMLEIGPAGDGVALLHHAAGREGDEFLRKVGDGGRHLDSRPRRHVGAAFLEHTPIEPCRGVKGSGHEIDHDVGEELVLGKGVFDVFFAVRAAPVRPCVEFLDDPGGRAHRTVHHGVGERLRLRHLEPQIGAFEFEGHGRALGPFALLLRLGKGGGAHAIHVQMHRLAAAAFFGGMMIGKPARDDRAPVAALRDIAVAAEHVAHQLVPEDGRGARPDGFFEPAGKAVARQRRDHEVHAVPGLAAEFFRMCELLDDTVKLEHRARPAMRHQHRLGGRARSLHMDEMELVAVDLRMEVRKAVQHLLGGAPVERLRPVGAKCPHIGHVGAIGPAIRTGRDVRHFMPFIGAHPGHDGVELRLRNSDGEGNGLCGDHIWRLRDVIVPCCLRLWKRCARPQATRDLPR